MKHVVEVRVWRTEEAMVDGNRAQASRFGVAVASLLACLVELS